MQPEAELLQGACISFAMRSEPPEEIVQRAQAISDLFGLPLHALRVVEAPRPGALDEPGSHSERSLARFIDAARASTRCFRRVLGARFAEERLTVHMGRFAEQVALHAEDVGAAAVIVAAGELRGTQVTTLARAVGRPVWVAYPRRGTPATILAATDLSDSEYPVLRQARVLATLQRAPMVAVHHVPTTVARRALSAVRTGRLAWWREEAREAELERISDVFGLAEARLLRTDDCVRAILDEARAHEADTIVVGTHARPVLERAVYTSVAAAIVDRAERCVLVEPLGSAIP